MINPQTELKTDRQGSISQSVWFDIPAANLADAMSFYSGLLGWEYSQMENSVLTGYVMIQVQGKLIGGLRQTPRSAKQAEGSGPILYFTVEDLSAKVARAKELGAEIVGETVNLGEGRGRYQWIRDRESNVIGLWAPA